MIRCLAVDDEPLALMQLATYIGKVPGLQLVGQCSSAIEALEIINRGGVDLLFTDISMPDMSGMDLVKQVCDKCLVVFTTAYSDYAIDGYKVEAIDYLLKPFGLSDVIRAADKARKRLETIRAANGEGPLDDEVKKENDYIFVKSDSRMYRIKVADIIMIEGMSEYVRVYVSTEPKPLMTLIAMKKVEQILPPDLFMRVHRSWIVNLRKVENVSHMRISIGGQLVPVSDNYKEKFAAYIDEHSLK